MQAEEDWIAKIKMTMAVDVQRFRAQRMSSREIVERLFDIPEVAQAFILRANRRRPLSIDPQSDAEKQEIIDALERVATWLADGFHEETVDKLREIAGELGGD